MPVKPARSMNITLIGRIAPPRRAPLPSLISRFTRSAGMYFRNAASPCAMSPIAPERFSISVNRDGCRCTLSRSKRSTCLISFTTLIRGAAIRRWASHADNSPAKTINTARPISKFRIVICTGPRNSDSGTTVTSDQPGNEIGVSTA